MNSFNEKEKSLTKIMFHSRKQLSKTEKEKRTIFPVEKEKFKKKSSTWLHSLAVLGQFTMQTKTKI